MKRRASKVSFLKTISKKWRRLSQPAKIVVLVIFLLVIGAGFYSIQVQRARIALIGTDPAIPPATSAFQYALRLDGSSYVTVNNSASIYADLNTGFTAEAWVKPAEATFSAMKIIDKTDEKLTGFSLWMDGGFNSGEGTYRVNYYFLVGSSGCSSPFTIFSQKTYTNPQDVMSWHHVAGVLQKGGKLDIFVDGKRSTSNFNSMGSTCHDTTIPVQVGARVPNSNLVESYFHGEMDEVNVESNAKYLDDFVPPYSPLSPNPATAFLYHLDNNINDANLSDRYGFGYNYIAFVPSTVPSKTVMPTCYPVPYCPPDAFCRQLALPSGASYCPSSPTPTPAPTCLPMPSCPPDAVCKLAAPPAGYSYCPVKPSPSPTALPGCYYKQVQCIQAPCDPILVCPSSPTPTPAPTCLPMPSCPPDAVCKLAAPPAGYSYCPVKPTPVPSCIPAPSCPPDSVCKLAAPPAGYTYCPVKQTPTPTPAACKAKITSLSMSNRCGTNGFSSYSYQCDGRALIKSAGGSCLDASAIYKKVILECGSVCAKPAPVTSR